VQLISGHPNTLRAWADKGIVNVVKLPSGYRRFTLGEIEQVCRELGRCQTGKTQRPPGDCSRRRLHGFQYS